MSAENDARGGGAILLAYLWHGVIFDDSNTRAALIGTGIDPPSVLDCLVRLIAYGRQTDCGCQTGRDLAEGVGLV